MKPFLLWTVLALLFSPGLALAAKSEGGEQTDANFERAKAKKVQDLKELLACFEGAQNKEAMKNCREQISKKRDMQERARKLQKIQEQKKKLEEQEQKLQSGLQGK